MKKYRLLGIAPYEGFKGYFLNSISKRNDIDADVFSVSLDEAVDLIKTLDLNEYDAIISRGRTGKMVQSVVDLPFVNVEFSGYDLLRSLKLTQCSGNAKIAFVSFFDLAQNVKLLCEILEYKTDIVIPQPPSTNKEMKELVKNLYYEDAVQIFIGDGACVECASELGAETILVTSGAEAMDKAVEDAVAIIMYKREEQEKNLFYHSLLEQADIPIALFDKERNLVYSKLFSDNDMSEIHKFLKKYVPKVFSSGTLSCMENTTKGSWKIQGKVVNLANKNSYVLFSVSKTFCSSEKKGLSFEIVDPKVARDSATLVAASTALEEVWHKIKHWSESKMPILIYGGIGTGKRTFAYAAYAISKYSNNPLISVDCSTLDIKGLSKLFEDERSPFYENDYTILFKKVNLLSYEAQNRLSYYLSNTSLTSRNKIISTVSGDAESMISSNQFSKDLYHQLAGVPVYLPPLQNRTEDIPSMARTFLTNINQQLPVQIVGFEPEAMNILQTTSWECGITQLNFFLKQLVTITKHQLITADDVNSLLAQSSFKRKPEQRSAAIELDISKTLEEISLDIIHLVLQEENNNHSKAAKRLGISRSTLWKKLNS